MKVARCWVKDEPLKRTMFKRNLTGQGRLPQKEARGGARGGSGGRRKQMNKFMGQKMKRKIEGSGAEEGGWSHQWKIFIVRTQEMHTKALGRFN